MAGGCGSPMNNQPKGDGQGGRFLRWSSLGPTHVNGTKAGAFEKKKKRKVATGVPKQASVVHSCSTNNESLWSPCRRTPQPQGNALKTSTFNLGHF